MTPPPTTYRDNFPRGALIGAAVLIFVTIGVVLGLRLSHVQPAAEVPAANNAIATVDLKFGDRRNGDVVVYTVNNAQRQKQVAVLKPATNGFLRATMRGLVQARRIKGAGRAVPFHLTELSDGRLVLADPVTHRRIYLRAFGPTNAEAFARFLPAAARKKRQLLVSANHRETHHE